MNKRLKKAFTVTFPAVLISLSFLFSSFVSLAAEGEAEANDTYASTVEENETAVFPSAEEDPEYSEEDDKDESVQEKVYTLRVNGAEEEHAAGETVTVTAKVPEGREFYSWVADCGDLGADLTLPVLTFAMPCHDVTLTVRSAKDGIPDGSGGKWDGTKTHYFIGNEFVTGFCEIGGFIYFFDPSTGEKASGKLVEVNGDLYYFYPAGNMVTSKELYINGPAGKGYYYLGSDGKLLKNSVVALPSKGRISWFDYSGKKAVSRTIWLYSDASSSWVAVYTFSDGNIRWNDRYVSSAQGIADFALAHPNGISPEEMKFEGLPAGIDFGGPLGWNDGRTKYYVEGTDGPAVYLTGFQTLDGKKYYFDPETGLAARGWKKIGNFTFYFNKTTGVMASGEILEISGDYYYFYPAGNVVIGKELYVSGPAGKGYYYFGSDGKLVKNTVIALPSAGRLSWFDLSGKKAVSRTIWLYSSSYSAWLSVYTLSDGNIKWDDRYVSSYNGLSDFALAHPDGQAPEEMKYEGLPAGIDCGLRTGWNECRTRYYSRNKEGKISYLTGFQTVDGKKYYFNPSTGIIARGWKTIGKFTFYFNKKTGVMASGEMLVIDGKYYYFYPAGNVFSGWLSYKGYLYYFYPDTHAAAVSCETTIDGKWCRFDTDGVLLKRGYHTTGGNPQVSVRTVVLPSYAKGTFSYVTPSRISVDATREQCIETFIGRAYEYVGTKYVNTYALAPGKGVDCSGLVLQCLYACGIDMGIYNTYNHHFLAWQEYNSMNWWNNSTFCRVPLSERKRGDLIIYRNHIAIYLGNDMIIDSYPPEVKVRSYYSLEPIGCMRVFN